MNSKAAKKLRKQLNFKRTKTIKIVGDQNINLGYRILNAPKTETEKFSDVELANRKTYKNEKNIQKFKNQNKIINDNINKIQVAREEELARIEAIKSKKLSKTV